MNDDDKGSWLETIVGTLDTSLLNAAATPNDITDEQLAKCRGFAATYPEVGLIGLSRFVDYIVRDWHRASKLDYVSEVVVRGKRTPARWGYVECSFEYPRFADSTWATVSVNEYLKRFEGLGGERWFVPLLELPALHSDCYQPGIMFRNLRYYETPEIPGFGGLATKDGRLSPLTDSEMPVAIRRLLAKRLGWAAHSLLAEPGAAISVDALMRAATIDAATMSSDAEQALKAIVVEMDGTGGDRAKADRCVGEGSDDLYR